jgi:hypothetical protein
MLRSDLDIIISSVFPDFSVIAETSVRMIFPVTILLLIRRKHMIDSAGGDRPEEAE